jgi:hypothetical protein
MNSGISITQNYLAVCPQALSARSCDKARFRTARWPRESREADPSMGPETGCNWADLSVAYRFLQSVSDSLSCPRLCAYLRSYPLSTLSPSLICGVESIRTFSRQVFTRHRRRSSKLVALAGPRVIYGRRELIFWSISRVQIDLACHT